MKRFKGGLRRLSATGAKPENGAFADAIKRKYVSLRGQAQSSRPALVFRAVPTSSKRARPAHAPIEHKRTFPIPSSMQPTGIPMRSEVRTIVKERVVERHTIVVREVERIVREQRVVREQAVRQPYTAAQPRTDAGRRASVRKDAGGSQVGERAGSRQPENGERELLQQQRRTQPGEFNKQLRKEQVPNDQQRPIEQKRNEQGRVVQERRQPEAELREHRQQERRPEAGDPMHRSQAPLPKSQTREQGELQLPPGRIGAERGRQESTPDRNRQERGPQERGSDTFKNGTPLQQQQQARQEASNGRDRQPTERREGKNVVLGPELSERAEGLEHISQLEELPLSHSEQAAANDSSAEAERKERAQPQLAFDEANEWSATPDDGHRSGVRHSDAKQSEDKPSHRDGRENGPYSKGSEHASASPNARQMDRFGAARAVSNADRVRARFLRRPSRVNKGLPGIGARTPALMKGIAVSQPAVRQLLARLSAGPGGTPLSAIRQLTLSSPGFVHARVRRQRRGAVASNVRTAAVPQVERVSHSGKPASNEPKYSEDSRREKSDVLHPRGNGSANSSERRNDWNVVPPVEPLQRYSVTPESGSQTNVSNSKAQTTGAYEADARPVENATEFMSLTATGHDSEQAYGVADSRQSKDSGEIAQERPGSLGPFKQDEIADQKLPNSQRMSAAGRDHGLQGKTDQHRLGERRLDGRGEDGQARDFDLTHEEREFVDRDPAARAASVRRGNETSNEFNRSLTQIGEATFDGEGLPESSSSEQEPIGNERSISGLVADHADPNRLPGSEQAFTWPFRLSLSARAVEREAVNREEATGREVLVHNVARRAFVQGAPSTALNRTYGSRWPSAWEAPLTLQIGEAAAASAKSDIASGQTETRAANLTNASDPMPLIVHEDAEDRTSSSRLRGSIRARRGRSQGLNEERQPAAGALRSSALSPLAIPHVSTGASSPLGDTRAAVQQSNGQPRLQSARLRGIQTTRSKEGLRLEPAPTLILKRNDRLGLPTEGRTAVSKRVGRQDRINASNAPRAISGRTADVRASRGAGIRHSGAQDSLSRSALERAGEGLATNAPRLVFKLGAVRSISSGGTDGTKAAAGRFAAGVTPSRTADFPGAATGQSGGRDGAAGSSPMGIAAQRSKHRVGQSEPGNRAINMVIENRKRVTNAENANVGLREALPISGALTPRKPYAFQDAAGRTMNPIHRSKKADGPAASGAGTRSSDPSRSGREDSAASAPKARLTMRDPLRQIAAPLRVAAASVGTRPPLPSSPNVAANASTEAPSVIYPKTRIIGENAAGFANVPINDRTKSHLNRIARGNERHSAAESAADAMPSQGTTRPKLVFDGTKTRPLQRLKLSREANVLNTGRDGAITYRTHIARTASYAPAAQRLAPNRPAPSASSASVPLETKFSSEQPKDAGRTSRSQAGRQDAHAAERLRPVKPVALTARSTRRAAVPSGASSPAANAISPIDGAQRTAGRQLINARQPSTVRSPAFARSPGLHVRTASAGATTVQLRRIEQRLAAPPELAKPLAAAQSTARAHPPVAAVSAADPAAAQLHRAASRTAAPADETGMAPAAALLQRSARQAGAPSAQPRQAPAAELRLRRSQQAGHPAPQPQAAPNAELELRRTPKAAAPAQPQPMQPVAQEPPRLSTEQLQQAVREMPELDPERLADTVYTALMRRMKFEQRLSGY